MKKSLITLLALSGVALGAAVQVNSAGTLSSTGSNYVYAWTSDSNTNGKWGYLEDKSTSGALTYTGGGYRPAQNYEGAIVGYTYDAATGVFTAESGTISSGFGFGSIGASDAYFNGTVSVGSGDIYSDIIHLAKDTTITVSADLGIKKDITLDFGDMTGSTSQFKHDARQIWTGGTGAVTLSGSYTFSPSDDGPKVIFSYNEFNGNALTFTNAFVVTAANGYVFTNKGIITDMAQLGIGESAVLWSGNNLQLVVKAPEPATATLSLLALAGLIPRGVAAPFFPCFIFSHVLVFANISPARYFPASVAL